MKVFLLAEARSSHVIKWVRALANKGLSIYVLSLFPYEETAYKGYKNIKIESCNMESYFLNRDINTLYKIHYIKALSRVKKIIKEFKPDILHAHFATSYGILGALSGFHPLIISVWGSDVYDFPQKSFFHKKFLEFNLKRADKILSTSHVMAKETEKYTNKPIEVTPFGVDLKQFKSISNKNKNEMITIGTIKALEDKYGIKYLLQAFKIVKYSNKEIPLKLLIVGGGSKESELKKLSKELRIDKDTEFIGKICFDYTSEYYNKLSIAVFPSILNSESFGVSVIEASACEIPVIVSNVGGLPEVTQDGVTGIVVEPKNSFKLAAAIKRLIFDDNLRIAMGKNGRERVSKLYDFNNNVNQMINIYQGLKNK